MQHVPGSTPRPVADGLADAFSAFIAASGTLEQSYRALQAEVSGLKLELQLRNAALKRSLAEKERMQAELLALIEAMPCGVLVVDAAGGIERINPEARTLLGSAAGTAGKPPRNLAEMAGAHSGIDLERFLHAAVDRPVEILLPPGGPRWAELRTRRLPSVAGERLILILRDVTAQREAALARERAQRVMALAEVASTLAHEMRNPLASMELFVDLLEAEPDRVPECAAHLRAGLRVLAHTVNNALSAPLDGAPATRCSMQSMLRPLRLDAAIAVAVEFVRPVVVQAGVKLLVELDVLRSVMVLGSEAALQQVVLNLVMNAVRHARECGEVRVAVLPGGRGEQAVLEVSDNGPGIAPGCEESIFEAGWSGSGHSSGLGLAVCRRIAGQHGATLRLARRSLPGACFLMEFPCLD